MKSTPSHCIMLRVDISAQFNRYERYFIQCVYEVDHQVVLTHFRSDLLQVATLGIQAVEDLSTTVPKPNTSRSRTLRGGSKRNQLRSFEVPSHRLDHHHRLCDHLIAITSA